MQWCEVYNISLVASYINTVANIQVDSESRSIQINTEYERSNGAFQQICETLSFPTVDLFATQLDTKCNRYVSWKPDPGSLEVDAFTISWANEYFYAPPPFSVISKCILKIIGDKAEGILVVPNWENQLWYPVFTKLLIGEPISLGPSKDLLFSGNPTLYGEVFPWWLAIYQEIFSSRGIPQGRPSCNKELRFQVCFEPIFFTLEEMVVFFV